MSDDVQSNDTVLDEEAVVKEQAACNDENLVAAEPDTAELGLDLPEPKNSLYADESGDNAEGVNEVDAPVDEVEENVVESTTESKPLTHREKMIQRTLAKRAQLRERLSKG